METNRMLQSAGGFVATAGVVSMVLYLINFNLTFLLWIDAAGPAVGWLIRIGMVIAGAIMFGVGRFVLKPSTASAT